jgi:hypothetical protein
MCKFAVYALWCQVTMDQHAVTYPWSWRCLLSVREVDEKRDVSVTMWPNSEPLDNRHMHKDRCMNTNKSAWRVPNRNKRTADTHNDVYYRG